jgi:hypothetical protein
MLKMMTRKRSVDGDSRTFKRINSKEELIGEHAALHPQRLQPTLRELSSRTRVFSSARIKDITIALANEENREKALKALANAHCSESLNCYLAICDWEVQEDGTMKDELADNIFSRFVTEGHEALCLPDLVRARILQHRTTPEEQADSIEEVKKHALNDLRFNSVLLKALGNN